jgi:hypothetical protein
MTTITRVRKELTSNPVVKVSRLIEITIIGSIVCLFILIVVDHNIANITIKIFGVEIIIGKEGILTQLNELKFDDLLSKGVRQLQRDGLGPFQEYSKEVRVIWTPESSDPLKKSSAAVCANDILYHEDLMFFNRSNQLVILRADRPLAQELCEHSQYSTIHISYNDASELLNNDPVLLNKFEYIFIVHGYVQAPVPVMASKSDVLAIRG